MIDRALRQSGSRPNEMCRAKVEHIHGEVIVLKEHKTARKTGKPRRIGIGKKLRAIIDESLAGRTEGNRFLSPSSKPWPTSGLGATNQRIRNQLGLPKHLCVYLPRHYRESSPTLA